MRRSKFSRKMSQASVGACPGHGRFVGQAAMGVIVGGGVGSAIRWNSLTPAFMRQGGSQPLSITTGL